MRRPLIFLFGLLIMAAPVAVLNAQDDAASPDYFETKVRPILAVNCYTCHTTAVSGGLRLDSPEAIAKGGDHGPSVTPGDPDKSLLITAVRQTDAKLKMPMGGKLKDSEIEALAAWVRAGAVWPKTTPGTAAAVATASPGAAPKICHRSGAPRLWSLLPLKEPTPPQVKDPRWSKTPIDRFVFAKLEKQGLKPVAPASKHDLLRRATLDLTGLPPTPEEIAAFEKDNSPDAFAKVVDRLLASPHYGERWGRMWLDVARYGEDDYRSLTRIPKAIARTPTLMLYRDWVIQAFNDDMPYDQFVKAQLAGDLLDPERFATRCCPATGFLGLGPWYYDNGAVEVTRADERHDRVDVVTRGFPRPDRRLRPLPRSQVRSDSADRLLFAGRRLLEHGLSRVSAGAEERSSMSTRRSRSKWKRSKRSCRNANQTLTAELSASLAFQTSNYLRASTKWPGTEEGNRRGGGIAKARLRNAGAVDRVHGQDHRQVSRQGSVAGHDEIEGRRHGRRRPRSWPRVPGEVVEVMLAKTTSTTRTRSSPPKTFGTKPKKRTNKPNEFITNDDFNPGCGLRLKDLPEEENNFWTEIFQRELQDDDDPTAMMAAGGAPASPAFCCSADGALRAASARSAGAHGRSGRYRRGAQEARSALSVYPRREDAENPVNLSWRCAAIRRTWAGSASPFPERLSERRSQPFKKGSGRLELAEDILKQPHRDARHREPYLERALRYRHRRYAQQLRTDGRAAHQSRAARIPCQRVREEWHVDQEAAPPDHAERGVSTQHAENDERISPRIRAIASTGARTATAWMRNRFATRCCRSPAIWILAVGGPAKESDPGVTRRTVYGKVSRYKLDEYLQTVRFPDAEYQRRKAVHHHRAVAAAVPDEQRLHAAGIRGTGQARRGRAGQPGAHPQGLHAGLWAATRAKRKSSLGLDYLHAEPMREYEENKNKPPEAVRGRPPRQRRAGRRRRWRRRQRRGWRRWSRRDQSRSSRGRRRWRQRPCSDEGGAAEVADDNAGMGMGMMGGMEACRRRRRIGGGGGGGGGGRRSAAPRRRP